MDCVLLLSDLVGSTVRAEDGNVVGRLLDLTADVGGPNPAVRRLAVGTRRRSCWYVEWPGVASFEQDDVRLAAGVHETDEGSLLEHEVLLGRDVLDTQVIDVAGKHLARVSDVVLDRVDQRVVVVGVEVGSAGVWRRLGWRRLAERASSRTIAWDDLHLTSARGHELQLAMPGAGVQRLDRAQLASVVSHLPTAKAAQVLGAVSLDAAAEALSAAHPQVSARLIRAVPRTTGSALVDRMPVDDATSALRGLPAGDVEALLGDVKSERAATLERLLAHPADTAGGLMNTEVLTAPVGEPAESIRARVSVDLPELPGLATVFVLDAQGRPVGCYGPTDLLAGRDAPRRVPLVRASTPVARVIDLFTIHDYLALPVVDDDDRLLGAVAVDDVLEELLAERLPGRGRYPRVRRRGRSGRPGY
jgi:sporulation protein YlmC with PRC-barrel domain